MATTKVVETARGRVHVADSGEGAAVLFVHGFPFDLTLWEPQLAALEDSHRVIAPDLRGFGQSPLAEEEGQAIQYAAHGVEMADYADDLAALLDALAIDRVALVGLSMGGYIGWQFATKHSARLSRLVQCNTKASPDTAEAAAGRHTTADSVLAEGTAALADAMLPKLFAASSHERLPQDVARVRAMMLAAPAQGVAAALRGMASRPDMGPRLKEISQPCLLIAGKEDPIATVQDLIACQHALPEAELLVCETGHLSPLEARSQVENALRSFLASD